MIQTYNPYTDFLFHCYGNARIRPQWSKQQLEKRKLRPWAIHIHEFVEKINQREPKMGIQINKGEELHRLRQFLLFANEGKIRKSHIEDQSNQASVLTLVTNAVIVWNTRYIQAVIDQLQKEGYTVDENDLTHVSPC